MKSTIKLFLLLFVGTSSLPSVVSAQDARDDADDVLLDEIIVSAQKREQNVFEVPMAVSQFSGTELERRGISAVSELQFAVPGLTMREDGPGSNTIFLRGVVNQYGSGAVVGQYLDEVPVTLTGSDQLDVRALDLQRVEVLKGPQGTLYGQGSVAGAVRYITNKPVLDRIEGNFSAAAGFLDGGDTEGIITAVLNAPVVEDTFGLRIAGRFQNGGGWQDQPAAGIQDGNDQDLVNVRLKALWKMTDSVDFEAMYLHHRNESDLGLGYENPDRTVFVAGDPATVLIPKVQEYSIANVTITAGLGSTVLTSSTSYIDNDHQYPFAYQCGPDTNCDPFEGNDDRFDTGTLFTQELRLSSSGENQLQWTIGAYYQDLSDQLIADYRTFDASSPTPFVSIFTDRFFSKDESESISVFADTSYQFTERLLVGVGGRYFEDDRSRQVSCCLLLGVPVTEQSESFDSFDPRVYFTFSINDNNNLYGSIATGYRSGGFNSFGDPPHDPEDVLSYEIGVKGFKPASGVSYELAAFYNDYSDMLRRGLVFNGTNFTSQLSNIGDVDIYGIEGGVQFRPGENFTVSAVATWLDTEVKEIRADDATNLPGDALDYVPELSYSLSGVYDFDWSPDRPGFARLDYYYRDEVSYIDRSSFDVLPQFAQSIGLLNARLGMRFGESHLVEVYGTNLTNENRWQDPYHQWRNANRTRPRTLGIKYTFTP